MKDSCYTRTMQYHTEGRYLLIEGNSLPETTVQQFFDTYIPSKKMQHLLIQNKWMLFNDIPVKRITELSDGVLSINLYPVDHVIQKRKDAISIVYEDELLVVVNKPNGVLVHGDGSMQNNLTESVKEYYADKPYQYDIQPLHRLDQETCGIVVFSKSAVFQPLLDQLMSQKAIKRDYLAFVQGKIPRNKSFTINEPIAKDRHNPNKRRIGATGQTAITHVKSLGYANAGYSVLLCTLETGRTHQIRVHLSANRYPLLNDTLYGVPSSSCHAMGLCAYRLTFQHPLKKKQITVSIEPPADLLKLKKAVR